MGFAPAQGIRLSLDTAVEAYTVRADGEIVSMLGVSQDTPFEDVYTAWILGTRLIIEHKWTFLAASRIFYEDWQAWYGVLTNYVDVRNTRSLRWLRWLGAKFDPPAPYGPYGHSFIRFTLGG